MVSQPGLGVCATYYMDDSSISITTENIVRDYGDENAEIVLRLENDNLLKVQLHPERRTKAFLQTTGRLPRSTAQFKSSLPLDIVVVPTLSPFEAREKWVTEETTRANEATRLSSRSFRNIWLRKPPEELQLFNDLIRKAWPNILLRKPTVGTSDRILEMNYVEDGNVREIYWAGFGFQVWLQMMTHVMRGAPGSILVLDEPDIYLHPDLQKKLTRVLQESFSQVFLATHSTEIINEVSAGDVLSIESRTRSARRITSEAGYRHVFNYLGSSENSEFARMARARRIVFFEGDDRRLLRRFAAKVARGQMLDDPDTVFLKTGGFGQWRRVSEVGWTVENLFGMRIKIAAIFDRDYRCNQEVVEFNDGINAPDILCQVLQRKEIENYCLVEPAIIRTMIRRAEGSGTELTSERCQSIIDEVFNDLHGDVRANTLGDYIRFHKRKHPNLNETTLVASAMAEFEPAWAERPRRFELVGGKEFLSALSHRLHSEVGRSITLAQIVQEMHVAELPKDLVQIIESIESFFAAQS